MILTFGSFFRYFSASFLPYQDKGNGGKSHETHANSTSNNYPNHRKGFLFELKHCKSIYCRQGRKFLIFFSVKFLVFFKCFIFKLLISLILKNKILMFSSKMLSN